MIGYYILYVTNQILFWIGFITLVIGQQTNLKMMFIILAVHFKKRQKILRTFVCKVFIYSIGFGFHL